MSKKGRNYRIRKRWCNKQETYLSTYRVIIAIKYFFLLKLKLQQPRLKRVYDINLADNVKSDMRLKRNNEKYHARNFHKVFFICLALGKSYRVDVVHFFKPCPFMVFIIILAWYLSGNVSVIMIVFFSANVWNMLLTTNICFDPFKHNANG